MEKWRQQIYQTSSSNMLYDERKAYEIALYWGKYDWGGRELSEEDVEANRIAVFGRL